MVFLNNPIFQVIASHIKSLLIFTFLPLQLVIVLQTITCMCCIFFYYDSNLVMNFLPSDSNLVMNFPSSDLFVFQHHLSFYYQREIIRFVNKRVENNLMNGSSLNHLPFQKSIFAPLPKLQPMFFFQNIVSCVTSVVHAKKNMSLHQNEQLLLMTKLLQLRNLCGNETYL